jgi:DnaK suppressor protein
MKASAVLADRPGYRPSEDEQFMSERQLEYFRQKLIDWKEDILRESGETRKLISKIDEALRRIEDGSYGYCEETGEPIGVARLDARPIATLSLEAQERHERRERVHRDD